MSGMGEGSYIKHFFSPGRIIVADQASALRYWERYTARGSFANCTLYEMFYENPGHFENPRNHFMNLKLQRSFCAD